MKAFITILLLITAPCLFAQKQVRTELRKGNGDYKQEKYTEAEIAYRKALELNAQSKEAAYNLGSALYRQGKFDEAARQYEMSSTDVKDKAKVAESMHNYGNSFLSKAIAADQQQAGGQAMIPGQEGGGQPGQEKMQSLEQSVAAYKQALRNNPADDETRYNLALAQKLLEQEKQNGGGGQDQQQDKQDQKQDQQQQQQQDRKQDQQQQQEQQQQQQQMERDKAEQILEAMKQNERETQEKVKEQQMRRVEQRKTEKNW